MRKFLTLPSVYDSGTLPPHLSRKGFLVKAIFLLAVFFLGLTACDSAGPPAEEDRPCESFAGCSTLNGISQVRGEPFVVSDALASDSVLYVALSSLTRRFDSTKFNPDEVYVLSRRLGGPEADSTWRLRQMSDKPEGPSGGGMGAPTLAFDTDGTVHLLWGNQTFFRGGQVMPTEILEATGRRGAWSEPVSIYEMPPLGRSLSSGRLPAPMARDGSGRLHAAFRIPDGTGGFGRVQFIRRQGGNWTETGSPFGEDTKNPWLEGTSEGALITAYIGLKDEGPSGLLFRKSPDGGQTWSAPEKIIGLGNSQEDPDVRVYAPKILESTLGTYHVLFPYDTPGQSSVLSDQIWHSVSRDGGQTWSEPGPVNSNDQDFAGNLTTAVDGGGRVHAVYYEGPVFSNETKAGVRHAVWEEQRWQQQPDLSTGEIMVDGDQAIGLTADPSGCLHAVWDEVVEQEEDGIERTTRLRYRRLGCS